MIVVWQFDGVINHLHFVNLNNVWDATIDNKIYKSVNVL